MPKLAKFVSELNGKSILIFGLGISGRSLVKALLGANASVYVADDNPDQIENYLKLGAKGFDYKTQKDYTQFAFLILSPGVPLTHPEPHPIVLAAKESGLEVIGDIELYYRAGLMGQTIGVTGTNGKSTTVSLITHILKACGYNAQAGGNIGKPIFDLDFKAEHSIAVLELSSFQIDLCPMFRPNVSVILNLSPDHIDRHGTMENYAEVKARLCEIMPSSDQNPQLIIAVDDPYTKDISERALSHGLRKVIQVATLSRLEQGVFVENAVLYDHCDDVTLEIGSFVGMQNLRGEHNYQNAACAYAAVKALGLSSEEIFNAMKSFAGLQHRQYQVRTINGVTYVNDSKATNAEATAMALACHDNVYWIVGGRKKKTGLDGLEQFFGQIKHAFLIGEAANDFADWLDKYAIDYTKAFTLDNALNLAHKMAQDNRGQPGGAGVVMLSPACASFDQFKSFEERGDIFCKLVHDLDEK